MAYESKDQPLIESVGQHGGAKQEGHDNNTLSDGEQVCLQNGEALEVEVSIMLMFCVRNNLTKAVKMMFENAPRPPVGSALVKETKVTPQTVRSLKASTV